MLYIFRRGFNCLTSTQQSTSVRTEKIQNICATSPNLLCRRWRISVPQSTPIPGRGHALPFCSYLYYYSSNAWPDLSDLPDIGVAPVGTVAFFFTFPGIPSRPARAWQGYLGRPLRLLGVVPEVRLLTLQILSVLCMPA